MKVLVRTSTFETNSSSSHSLAYVPADIAERWEKDEILIKFHGIRVEDAPMEEPYDIEERDVIEKEDVNDGLYPGEPYYVYEQVFPIEMFEDLTSYESEETDMMVAWKAAGVESAYIDERHDDGALTVSVWSRA